MTHRPKVSVLVIFYDNGDESQKRFFSEAVDSILAQDFGDFELVIAVSGKKGFAQKIAEKSRKIRLFQFNQPQREGKMPVEERLRGIVKARRICVKQAKADFIAWADADDLSKPERLRKQYDFLMKHSDVGVVGCGIEIIDNAGYVLGEREVYETDKEIRERLFNCVMHQQTTMARKKIVEECGGYRYDELSEDYDLWVRMAPHTKFHNLQERLVSFRSTSGGSGKYRLPCYLSNLKIKLRAVHELGVRPNFKDVSIDLLTLAAIFYPERILGKKIYGRFAEIINRHLVDSKNRYVRNFQEK